MTKCIFPDRPDPPRFPAVDNIGVDSLALSWKAPVWDGGSDITNYLVEKREHPMSSWIRVGNTRYVKHTYQTQQSTVTYIVLIRH